MTIARKFTAASGVLVALSAVVGAVAVASIGVISQKLNLVVNDSLTGTYLLGRIDSLQLDLRGATLHHVATPDPKVKGVKDKQAVDIAAQSATFFQEYQKTINTPRDRELFQPIPGFFDSYVKACEKVRALSLQGKSQDAMAVYDTEGDATRKRLKEAIKDLIEYKRTAAAENATAAAASASGARITTFLIVAGSLVAGGLLAFFIIGGINKSLRQTIDQLSHGAEELKGASAQVSSASQSLAQGASEQASAIEETSASAHEITTMTNESAANSRSAATMMDHTAQGVETANQSLDVMLSSMNEITSSAEKISKINRVIDEIAFQTNILALNAAVEAARAGEAGMGFAVVADEVRNLAQRSAQAAKDTADLIADSISKSNEGRQKLDQVAGSIRQLTENTAKSKALVDSVNSASQQQSQGIQQISQAVAEMEAVTQRSAASAEETASTSQELSAQAATLTNVVASLQALVE